MQTCQAEEALTAQFQLNFNCFKKALLTMFVAILNILLEFNTVDGLFIIFLPITLRAFQIIQVEHLDTVLG